LATKKTKGEITKTATTGKGISIELKYSTPSTASLSNTEATVPEEIQPYFIFKNNRSEDMTVKSEYKETLHTLLSNKNTQTHKEETEKEILTTTNMTDFITSLYSSRPMREEYTSKSNRRKRKNKEKKNTIKTKSE